MEFTKLSASGNDFICLDNRTGQYDAILADQTQLLRFAQGLCQRGKGIGADGIVFASLPEIPDVADIAATFLESDGSQSSLCGNGTACFVRWAQQNDIVPDGEVRILTPAGVVLGQPVEEGYVRVCIPHPENIQTDLQIRIDNTNMLCDFVVTGVEHLITYVDDVDQVDVAKLGPEMRHHSDFPQPPGVNANFVQILGRGELAIRTFEYGVEAETLACGTGSAAAAILSTMRFGWGAPYTTAESPVQVHARGGDVLRVYFRIDDTGTVKDPCLETRVRCTYTGTLCPELTEEILTAR